MHTESHVAYICLQRGKVAAVRVQVETWQIKAIIKHERKQYELYRRDLEQWKSAQAGLHKKDK